MDKINYFCFSFQIQLQDQKVELPETKSELNGQKLVMEQTKTELRQLSQLFYDGVKKINLDTEVAKMTTVPETCGHVADLGIKESRAFLLDPAMVRGKECPSLKQHVNCQVALQLLGLRQSLMLSIVRQVIFQK